MNPILEKLILDNKVAAAKERKLMLDSIVAFSKEGQRVIAQAERRRIVARLQALSCEAAHWPHVIAATEHRADYLYMVNEGIRAGYTAAIHTIEQMEKE